MPFKYGTQATPFKQEGRVHKFLLFATISGWVKDYGKRSELTERLTQPNQKCESHIIFIQSRKEMLCRNIGFLLCAASKRKTSDLQWEIWNKHISSSEIRGVFRESSFWWPPMGAWSETFCEQRADSGQSRKTQAYWGFKPRRNKRRLYAKDTHGFWHGSDCRDAFTSLS